MSADVRGGCDESGERRSLDGTEPAENPGEAAETAAADRRERRPERPVTHTPM